MHIAHIIPYPNITCANSSARSYFFAAIDLAILITWWAEGCFKIIPHSGSKVNVLLENLCNLLLKFPQARLIPSTQGTSTTNCRILSTSTFTFDLEWGMLKITTPNLSWAFKRDHPFGLNLAHGMHFFSEQQQVLNEDLNPIQYFYTQSV